MPEIDHQPRSSGRVLVAELGEADMDLLEPWAEEAQLPTLPRMMREGTYGRLWSQTPPMTPQVWGTILTGRSPGHNGVFDFWQRNPNGQFQEMHGGDIRQIAQPPNLYDEIVEQFGRYRFKDVFRRGRRKSDYLGLIPEDVEKQTDVFVHLLSTKDWDFGLVYISAAAVAKHYFWADIDSEDTDNSYADVVPPAYRAVDCATERLINSAGTETIVFVVSDCGAAPLRTRVHVNNVLEKAGLRRCEAGRSGARSRDMIRSLRRHIQKALNCYDMDSVYFSANRNLGPLKKWIQFFHSATPAMKNEL